MKRLAFITVLLLNLTSLFAQNSEQTEFHYTATKCAYLIVNNQKADGLWKNVNDSVIVDIAKQTIFIIGKDKHVYHWQRFENDDDTMYSRTHFYCRDQDSVMAIVSVIRKLDDSHPPFRLAVQYADKQFIYKMEESEVKKETSY